MTKEEIDQLKAENKELRAENRQLRTEVRQLSWLQLALIKAGKPAEPAKPTRYDPTKPR